VLSDDLSGLWGDPVGEADGELNDEVAALRRVLGEGKPLPPEPLDRARPDDVVAGQRDHPLVQRGDVHGAATQRLAPGGEGERGREREREGEREREREGGGGRERERERERGGRNERERERGIDRGREGGKWG